MKQIITIMHLLAFFTVLAQSKQNESPKVVCYWGTWAYYHQGEGKFQAEDIDPSLCTHINYAFAKLTDNQITVYDHWLDIDLKMMQRLNDLRKENPNLKTLISIGGWNEGSDKYSAMVSTAATRQTFVDSVMQFLAEYGFSGIDIDWEYPTMQAWGGNERTPGREQDREDFITLLQMLHDAFEPHGCLLSVAVAGGKAVIDRGYDVPRLFAYVDYVNVMTYDYHGAWDHITGHDAPLYPDSDELTASFGIEHWLELGADPQKLIMGIPLYGRTFTLADAAQNGIGANAVGGGNPGPFTNLPGVMNYNEICTLVKSGKWEIHWNDTEQIPYATQNNQWIGYDSQRSVQQKVQFILQNKLGGAIVWSIDGDDFGNHCGDGKYPLLKTVAQGLQRAKKPKKIYWLEATGDLYIYKTKTVLKFLTMLRSAQVQA